MVCELVSPASEMCLAELHPNMLSQLSWLLSCRSAMQFWGDGRNQ